MKSSVIYLGFLEAVVYFSKSIVTIYLLLSLWAFFDNYCYTTDWQNSTQPLTHKGARTLESPSSLNNGKYFVSGKGSLDDQWKKIVLQLAKQDELDDSSLMNAAQNVVSFT